MHIKDEDGIDLISCKCFAPLFRQLSLFDGSGILTRLPLNKGLHDTILIFKFSAV